jgi:hypothetical protein
MIFVVNVELHNDEDTTDASLVVDAYGVGKTAEDAFSNAVSNIARALSKSESEGAD